MPSERVQRQIDRLLDEADAAVAAARDWARVRELAQDVLRFDPESADALAYLQAAERDAPDAPAGRPSPEPTAW